MTIPKPCPEQFRNKWLKERLLQRDNIPVLEDLLAKEGEKFEKLKKLKNEGKLDFGPKISKEDLESTCQEIEREVDTFLDTSYAGTCTYKYHPTWGKSGEDAATLLCGASTVMIDALALAGSNVLSSKGLVTLNVFAGIAIGGHLYLRYHELKEGSNYMPKKKIVTLGHLKRADLLPTAGHEYAHHIQYQTFLVSGCSIFKEGHARGVQRHISELLREREGDEAFIYDMTKDNIIELAGAYAWMNRRLGTTPKRSLTKKISFWERWNSAASIGLVGHILGNTLFYIYETTMGPRIYRDMIHDTFTFPNQAERKNMSITNAVFPGVRARD